MNQPPKTLPEGIHPQKNKNQPPPSNVYRGVISGILVALVLIVSVIALFFVFAPDIVNSMWGIDSTLSALQFQSDSLQLTAQYQNEYMLNLQETQAFLNNNESLLDQTATQNAVNIVATQTAQANLSIQESTQAAFSYSQTQAALNQLATQNALDATATSQAIGNGGVGNTSSAMPTQFPAFNQDGFGDAFNNGLQNTLWNFQVGDWGGGTGSLVANRTGAWLTSLPTNFVSYQLDIDLTPRNDGGDYFILLNVQDPSTSSIALKISADDSRFGLVTLYRVNISQVTQGEGLFAVPSGVIETHNIQVSRTNLHVRAVVTGSQITILLNDQQVMTTVLETPIIAGGIGVQFPQGASLNQVTVTEY